MSRRLLLIGGGGHCKSILDSLLKLNVYSKIGIVDQKENIGKKILGIPVIGCDGDLSALYQDKYTNAFISVGSIGYPNVRIKLYNIIKNIGFTVPNIIDPSSTVSDHIILEEGIYIGKNTTINAGSIIHKCAIINTGSILEHDCIIGQFSHVSPGSVLCGEVQIGNFTHIGAGSVIKQQAKVGANTLIGMGSIVLEDISDNILAYGNPCKEIKKL